MLIDSFSIAYSAIEDRLLLQARSEDINQNFWVTRRAAVILNQALQLLLNDLYAQSGMQKKHVPLAQSFGQEHAQAQHAPFPDELQNPNTTPLLLFRVDYGVAGTDLGRLVLLNEAGAGQEFNLNVEMLHALKNLLGHQCTTAEWLIALDPLVESESSASESLQKTLH